MRDSPVQANQLTDCWKQGITSAKCCLLISTIKLFTGDQMKKIFGLLLTISIVGCAEPSVRNGTLLQYPTSKVQQLYIDTSGTGIFNLANSWPRKVEPEFKEAVPEVFAQYGVNARVLELKNEVDLHDTGIGDYILSVRFSSGIMGSYGTASNYALDLFSAKSHAKVWSGSIAGAGSATIATQNLGVIIAKNIATSMDAAHLFSDEFVKAHPTATDVRQGQAVLSGGAAAAFEKFKKMKWPKAFVIADDGRYVYEGWDPGMKETPAERALAKCEALKFRNCHVISDGIQVF
jgi:hypothetical protein